MNGDRTGDRFFANVVLLDPRLQPLANNGGLGQTHMPYGDSPCVDNGKDALVTTPDFTGPPYKDQLNKDRIQADAVDAGAVEFDGTELVKNTNDAGAGSLRQAILNANSTGGKRITFSKGSGGNTDFSTTQQIISLTTGELSITRDVTITAPAVGVRVLASTNRGFNVNQAVVGTVSMDGIVMQAGGIILSGMGTTLLKNCMIQNCTTADGAAANVGTGTTLHLHRTTLHNNSATTHGGGVFVDGGTLILTHATVASNSAAQSGGGVFIQGAAGSLFSINSTLSDNIADSDANNTGNGGGIIVSAGTARLWNTLVAGNSDLSTTSIRPDLSGTFVSSGHNLIGSGTGISGITNGVMGDKAGTNAALLAPVLSALDLHSGTTVNFVPQTGSPALDSGDAAALSDPIWPADPDRDQRGQFRIYNGTVDIGAVEAFDGILVKIQPAAPVAKEGGNTASWKFSRSFDTGDLVVRFKIQAASTALTSDYSMQGNALVSVSSVDWDVTIPAGQLNTTLTVVPTQDLLDEPAETVSALVLDRPAYDLDPGETNTTAVTIEDDDIVVTNGLSTGPGSLRQAITDTKVAGGGQISFASPDIRVLLTSPLTLDSTMEIIGTNNVITGQNLARIFDVSAGCVLLQGLDMTGGNADQGGALRARNAGTCVMVKNCRIHGNTASQDGGGIYASDATLDIRNSSLDGNTATNNNGGGLACVRTQLLAINLTVADNAAKVFGGGISLAQSAAQIFHATISRNTADSNADLFGDGGGLWCDADGVISLLVNCLIAGNFDSPNNATGTIHSDVSGDFFSGGGNFIGRNTGGETQYPAGQPNISNEWVGTAAAPLNALLVTVPGSGPLVLEPSPGSLAIDHAAAAVIVAPIFAAPATDQLGRARISGVGPDMGAVETDFFIVTNTNNTGAGSLRNAVGSATTQGHGTVVFSDTAFAAPGIITLSSGISVASTDPAGLICIRGKINTPGQITIRGNGADRLFSATAGHLVFKYVTLKDGNAAARVSGSLNGGAVLSTTAASLTFEDCIVRENLGSEGGAIYSDQTPVFLTRSYFLRNDAVTTSGGALRLLANAPLHCDSCSFEANTAQTNGGAFSAASVLNVENSTFSANKADGDGGAINLVGAASMTLLHGTVTENIADEDNAGGGDGGGIAANGGPVIVTNSIIAQNIDRSGGAVDVKSSAAPIFDHSLIGLDARLDILRATTGVTRVHRPKGGSPAVGAASAAVSTLLDQRGELRTTEPDMGAYEWRKIPVINSSSTGVGSLRQAITDATGTNEPTVITFASFTDSPISISANTPQFSVSSSLWIRGRTDGRSSIGILSNTIRTIDVTLDAGEEFTLSDVRIENGGSTAEAGGCIRCQGSGTLQLLRCLVRNGTALRGGGLSADGGTVVIENSTFADSDATTDGGGLHLKNATTTLLHSTISDNTASGKASGVYQEGGTLTLTNCIIHGNEATSTGSVDFAKNPAAVTLRAGANFIGDNTGVIVLFPTGNPNGNGDFIGVDPRLGLLANNGGSHRTFALRYASPAINAGGTATLGSTDGRGLARDNGAADSGAYELRLETYDYWATYSFLTGTSAPSMAATFDLDHDGIANGLEYFMGTNPTDSRSNAGLQVTSQGGFMRIDFSRSPVAPTSYALMRSSTNLQTWGVPLAAGFFSEQGIHATTNAQQIRATIPIVPGSRRFFRMELAP